MKKKFNHLKTEERELIAVRYAAGVKPQEIANEIGKHVSAIYRELKRNNSSRSLYLPIEADNQAKENLKHTNEQEFQMNLLENILKTG